MDFNEILTTLRKNLSQHPLPGRIAHEKMARFGRKFDFETEPPKLAAVMVLLYPKENTTYFVLIQRAGHPLDPHQHQISLPGGKKEANEDLSQTSIRETFEEIGVPQSDINMLSPISNVYVGASNFLIHPFMGYVESTPTFIRQASEVHEILEIPIAHLLDSTRIKRIDITVRDSKLKSVPYFDLSGKVVWGATAMILNEVKEIFLV